MTRIISCYSWRRNLVTWKVVGALTLYKDLDISTCVIGMYVILFGCNVTSNKCEWCSRCYYSNIMEKPLKYDIDYMLCDVLYNKLHVPHIFRILTHVSFCLSFLMLLCFIMPSTCNIIFHSHHFPTISQCDTFFSIYWRFCLLEDIL